MALIVFILNLEQASVIEDAHKTFWYHVLHFSKPWESESHLVTKIAIELHGAKFNLKFGH